MESNVFKPNSPVIRNAIDSLRRRMRCTSCSFENENAINSSFLASTEEDNSMNSRSGTPEVMVTRRNRTVSICGREFDIHELGTVRYFCRSRGHGFITPTCADKMEHSIDPTEDVFVHISDIESDYVPEAGDCVSYHVCPIPPRYDKFQAIRVQLLTCGQSGDNQHKRWDTPESPEDVAADSVAATSVFDV